MIPWLLAEVENNNKIKIINHITPHTKTVYMCKLNSSNVPHLGNINRILFRLIFLLLLRNYSELI